VEQSFTLTIKIKKTKGSRSGWKVKIMLTVEDIKNAISGTEFEFYGLKS
jgi:hypothetical protein